MPDRLSVPIAVAVAPPGAWRPVALGLRIKLAALPLIIAGPFVLLNAALRGWPIWVGLATLAVGLGIDCLGRCCCAAAPLPHSRKAWLYGSVLCQGVELALSAACWAIYANVELVYWLLVAAGVLHFIAAFLFTRFMRVVLAAAAGSSVIQQRIQTLDGSLLGVIGAGSGLTLTTFFVGLATFVFVALTCAFGWTVAIPLAIVFIVPCLLVLGGVLVFLCVQYALSVWSLSAALVAAPATSPPVSKPGGSPFRPTKEI